MCCEPIVYVKLIKELLNTITTSQIIQKYFIPATELDRLTPTRAGARAGEDVSLTRKEDVSLAGEDVSRLELISLMCFQFSSSCSFLARASSNGGIIGKVNKGYCI